QRTLDVIPKFAPFDFIPIRPLVQAPLAPRFKLEMLHGVGDEYVVAVEARIADCAIEHASCGANKRVTCEIFVIARLLAEHHQTRMRRSLTATAWVAWR